MPEEVRLSGPIQLRPTPEGGRDVVIAVSPNKVYILPLNAEGRAEVARGLALEDSDMQREADRKRAAQKLVVPNRMNGRPV